MQDFVTFLTNPSSISPLTPRTYIAQYIQNTTDLTKLISIVKTHLANNQTTLPTSIVSILTPTSDSPEAYASRVLIELSLLKYPKSMAHLLKDERNKAPISLSPLDRWLQVSRSLAVVRPLQPSRMSLDALKARVNEKYSQDESQRRNLENFLRFKQHRNEFYLRQQRFEEAQLRQHVQDLRKQLAMDKAKKSRQSQDYKEAAFRPEKSQEAALETKMHLLIEKSHKVSLDRARREWRAKIRREDYAKALDNWKTHLQRK